MMALATNTVGVSMEKLGDILKDTKEKVGEFITTGGGGFQDFADTMGLTKEEAREAALEFENMAGSDVLQAMTSRMEEAGISTSRMSFALEGMASDTTDLIPLLLKNGKALDETAKSLGGVDAVLSELELKKIQEVSQKLDEMTNIFSAEARGLIAEYSDTLVRAIEAILVFAKTSTDAFNVVIAGLSGLLSVSQALVTDFVNDINTTPQALSDAANNIRGKLDELFGEDEGKEKGKAFVKGVIEGITSDDTEIPDVITGTTGGLDDADKNQSALDALLDRFKSETELLAEKLEEERELLNQFIPDEEERNAALLSLGAEFADNIIAIEEEKAARISAIKANQAKKEINIQQKADRAELSAKKSMNGDLIALGFQLASGSEKAAKAMFLVSKGLMIAETFNSTQAAVMRTLAELGPIVGAPVAASIEASGYVRMGLIAASAITGMSSGGGGGGSISVGSGSSSSFSESVPEQQETSDLELSERGTTNNDIVVRFATDTGDELLDALAGGLNDRERRG